MSAMLLVHMDEQRRTSVVKWAYMDGQLSGVAEQITDYLMAHNLADSVWENVAGDRMRVILEQQYTMRQLDAQITDMKQWAELAGYPAREAVR